MIQPPETHKHEKYEHSVKYWYFWFDYDKKISRKLIPMAT